MTTQEKIDELIKRRTAIVEQYCVSRGWSIDPSKLSLDQIFEIRALDTWKNVPKDIELNHEQDK